MLPENKGILPLARDLRNNATRHENHLWYDFLKNYPVQFYRQKVILNYIVDFYCPKGKIVVELDGSQHRMAERIAADEVRTGDLEELGLIVIRFANTAIENRFLEVCREIHESVCERYALAEDIKSSVACGRQLLF